MIRFDPIRLGLRRILNLLTGFMLLSSLMPSTVMAASTYAVPRFNAVGGSTPKPNLGPQLNPYALPVQSVEASSAATAGDGVSTADTAISEGLTLNPTEDVCNDFGRNGSWAATEEVKHALSYVHHHHSPTVVPETLVRESRSNLMTDWYAGWAPFAVDDGGRYHASGVAFAREHVVGPGTHYGHFENYSAKISSMQPYAAGFGSPLISVKPGATVTVTVNYLLFNHDNGAKAYDWASLGIKPDAAGPVAEYVNGYVRGEWATLSHTLKAGHSGKIMVLLQASSPVAVNSNVYFDDIKIEVNGKYKQFCTRDSSADKTTAGASQSN
ncbi:MAG: hypothetical protein U0350_49855 [Caldilineaceae bacterium]